MRRALFLLCFVLPVFTGTLIAAAPARAHDAPITFLRPDWPDEQTHGTDHFLVHYTLDGNDAVDPADTDASGIPDYVEAVGEAMEYSWNMEIDVMGWDAPPPDDGAGGDDRLDVYLENILDDDYAGLTDTEGSSIGDNPNSSEVERRAAASFITLDNDFVDAELNADETPLELMQATAAHEFNHAVQSGYDAVEPHTWLFESTATWMEDEVYPDVNDGVYYLEDVFSQPDVCLVDEDGWYGNWLLMRQISERYGRDAVRSIWENLRGSNGFRGVDEALAPLGTSLEQEILDYGVGMLLRDYTEGSMYPAVYVEGTANPGSEFEPNNGVQSFGVDFVRLSGSSVISITLNDVSGYLRMRAVGIRGPEADVFDAPADAPVLAIDLSLYQQVFVLVQSIDRTDDEEDCDDIDYTLTVADSTQPISPVTVVRSAANYGDNARAEGEIDPEYEPPQGQPFEGSGDEASESPEDLDVGFTPIIPLEPPPGYVFDLAYIMSEDELEDIAPFYVPGGGDSANYDYVDADDNWLSITESPSPYTTLQEWMDDIDHETDGEFIDISGVEVLIEDWSEEDDPWFSATFIYQGLFIVVDGDHDRESVVAMAEAVISGVAPDQVPTSEPTAVLPTMAPDVITPVPDAPLTDTNTGLIAGVSAGLLALCCASLCLVGGIVGIGIFLFTQRKPA